MSRILHSTVVASLIVLALSPVSAASAAGTWDTLAEDTIAGFGTEIEVRGPESTKFYVVVEPPSGGDIEHTAKTDSKGKAIVELFDDEAEVSGTYSVIIEDRDGNQLADTSFEVFPDVPARLELEPEEDVLQEGEETIIQVGLFDRYDNPLPDRPLLMISGDGEVEKIDSETGEDGFAAFSFIAEREGDVDITVVDLLSEIEREFVLEVESSSPPKRKSSRFSASLLDEFDRDREDGDRSRRSYGFVDHFAVEIESAEPVLKVNEAYNLSIIAQDRHDRRVEDYVGRIVVETTDTLASIPQSDVRFHASDRGSVDLPLSLMFGTPGEHKLFVQDKEDEDIRGIQESVWVVGRNASPEQGRIIVESHRGVQTISSRHATISGTAPAYINLDLFANEELLQAGSSDENGRFSFSITLGTEQAKNEMIIREGGGGRDRVSESFTLIVDMSAPEITEFLLMPDTVAPGAPVTVTIIAGPSESVMATVDNGAQIVLTEKSQISDGMVEYETSIVAPEEIGTHTVTVTVRDRAGNEFKRAKQFVVEGGGLPVVQNVETQSQDQTIVLSWAAVPGAIGYRIYFGTSPSNLTNHIDTNSTSTSARLTGIAGGQTTYFAITAINAQGEESQGQSELASATTRGSIFDIQVFGQVNGAHAQWVAPPGVDIEMYRIQYGVQSGIYTEERVISGENKQYTFGDLINGVMYYILLSAVQANGQILIDRIEPSVVAGQAGKPGMHLAPVDPLPSSIGGPPSRTPPVHGTTPSTQPPNVPGTGLPLWVWLSSILLGVSASMWYRFYYKNKLQRDLLHAVTHP